MCLVVCIGHAFALMILAVRMWGYPVCSLSYYDIILYCLISDIKVIESNFDEPYILLAKPINHWHVNLRDSSLKSTYEVHFQHDFYSFLTQDNVFFLISFILFVKGFLKSWLKSQGVDPTYVVYNNKSL